MPLHRPGANPPRNPWGLRGGAARPIGTQYCEIGVGPPVCIELPLWAGAVVRRFSLPVGGTQYLEKHCMEKRCMEKHCRLPRPF